VRRDLEATQFTVGIFGLIKRGKSTLLNGLIGREVSSMHVTPETAVPVYVSYGEQPEATVHFADGGVKHVAVEEVRLHLAEGQPRTTTWASPSSSSASRSGSCATAPG
jgi:hypothetical protein